MTIDRIPIPPPPGDWDKPYKTTRGALYRQEVRAFHNGQALGVGMGRELFAVLVTLAALGAGILIGAYVL